MSDSRTFHAQLAAIIDVLANSAVAEICKLVDDGYALLRLEVSQSQKQNDALKRRLRMMELRVARGLVQIGRDGEQEDIVSHCTGAEILERSKKITEDCFLAEGTPPGKGLDITSLSDGELAAKHKGRSPGLPDVTSSVQPVEVEETKPKLSLIKMEKPEEDLRNGSVESRAGCREKRPVQETQNKAANHSEELTEQHRTRRAVWEVSGLESALKPEGENECVEILQQRGAELRTEGLNSLDSEFVMFERPGQLGSYWTQENVDVQGDNPPEMNSELPLVHTAKSAAGESQFSLASQNQNPEVVLNETVSVKMEDAVQMQCFWDVEGPSGPLETQRRGSVCGLFAEATARENVALPPIDQSDANGCVSYENLFPSKSAATVGVGGARRERYVCRYCGKSCARASDLKVHHRVHTGEKPFSCTQCGKRFSQSCSLKKHQIVHTGEKPFACLQCGKQFSDSSNLRKHRSIHTGERPFGCSLCGKRFKQSCYLKTHMKIHTGDKPLNCAHCGKAFASKYSLKLHQLKDHMAPYSVQ